MLTSEPIYAERKLCGYRYLKFSSLKKEYCDNSIKKNEAVKARWQLSNKMEMLFLF